MTENIFPRVLGSDLEFPSVNDACADGLLAIGGDLSTERVLLAYRSGIFPWYAQYSPILWWAPDPRMILLPDELKVSDSMARIMRGGRFEITFDRDFPAVIDACSQVPRPGQDGTWITPEILDAYVTLHEQGYAHSVEAWQEGRLAGGLYGITLGKAFFGESMFAHQSNASKAALIRLVDCLRKHDYDFIDCQVHTPHLESLGARPVARSNFMKMLDQALQGGEEFGSWDAN